MRPAHHRPPFWEGKYGVFIVWLFAIDATDAQRRAQCILDVLPYDLWSGDVAIGEDSEPSSDDKLRAHQEAARALGISTMLMMTRDKSPPGETAFRDALTRSRFRLLPTAEDSA